MCTLTTHCRSYTIASPSSFDKAFCKLLLVLKVQNALIILFLSVAFALSLVKFNNNESLFFHCAFHNNLPNFLATEWLKEAHFVEGREVERIREREMQRLRPAQPTIVEARAGIWEEYFGSLYFVEVGP